MPFISLLKCGLPRFVSGESGALASRALGAFVLGLGLAAATPFVLFDDVAEGDDLAIVLINGHGPSFAEVEAAPRTLIAALDFEDTAIAAN